MPKGLPAEAQGFQCTRSEGGCKLTKKTDEERRTNLTQNLIKKSEGKNTQMES